MPKRQKAKVAMENERTAWEKLDELPKGPPLEECPSTYPERHLLGEFPMTCRRCHEYAANCGRVKP